MGSRRNSLRSLMSFHSRGSSKTHARSDSASYNSGQSAEMHSNNSSLSSPRLLASSDEVSPRTPRTPEASLEPPLKPAATPMTPISAANSAGSALGGSYGCPEDLHWELLHQVLCLVSPDNAEFFAVHIDSTKSWYRGYLFHSEIPQAKLIPFALKRNPVYGKPALEWLTEQSCTRSLQDSVRITSLEWLFAIPGQRMAEIKIVQLIHELRRLSDPSQCVQFMNKVNSVLGLPIYAREIDGSVIPIGKLSPLNAVKQQVSIASKVLQPVQLSPPSLAELLPRDLEMTLLEYETSTPAPALSQFLLRLHLRYVTPSGVPGKRLSADYVTTFESFLTFAFKHLLPTTPALLARSGRIVLVCELIDSLTTRYLGVGIARIDAPLQPENLNQSFVVSLSLYDRPGSKLKNHTSLYKSLISGGATGLKLSRTIEELRFEVVSKLRVPSSVTTVPSTDNDYLNCSESLFVDIGELVILKQPSILTGEDPFLIRVEGREATATPGHEVNMFFKLDASASGIHIELLSGSTVIASSKPTARGIPIAANTYRVALFDLTDEETLVGFVNVHQTYVGREKLQPPAAIASILSSDLDFSLDSLQRLGLSDLKIWLGPLLESILTQLLDQVELKEGASLQKLFKAFVILLSLGMADETRYLYQCYVPSRRILAAPLASLLLQQYTILLDEQASELEFAFKSHLLLGRILQMLGVSPYEFLSLTQTFMSYFTSGSAPEYLLILCLEHLDELYVYDTSPEIASQIGSILTAASYSSQPAVAIEFYWLLSRVARCEAYSTVFAQQFSSLVFSLTERFWELSANGDRPVEETRAIAALMMGVARSSVEAPAYLSLVMGALVANEPAFRAIPSAPLFEPHPLVISTNSERSAAIIELCMTIYELTGPKSLPSRTFLHQLENPSDLAYQLCSCSNIMMDSVAPHEWASLDCALLHCAMRCLEYSAAILELVALPEENTQAKAFNKEVWRSIFIGLLKLISEPRLNYGLVRVGMKMTPLQHACIEPSLLFTGVDVLANLWQKLAKGRRYGGYQVQFYTEQDFWGYLLLVGLNSGNSVMCTQVAEMIASLLEGGFRLYGASSVNTLQMLVKYLDYMFRYLAPLTPDNVGKASACLWPQFRSTEMLLDFVGGHLTDPTYDLYGGALETVLSAQQVLSTYWSEKHSRGTLLALWEVLMFLKECCVEDVLGEYFTDFVEKLRSDGTEERLGMLYFVAAQIYAGMDPSLPLKKSDTPCLPPQPAGERRKALSIMSLQHLVNARSWKLAERVLETELQWLKDAEMLQQRAALVTKWLPTVTSGLASYTAPERNWYLLKFRGEGFGCLENREFLWETDVKLRLADATSSLSAIFNGVASLPWDHSITDHGSAGCYVSILSLDRENNRFVHTRPLHDQRVELIQIDVADDMPLASGFVEVSDKQVQIMEPADVAVRDLRSKMEELQCACASHNFKRLDLTLSGILNAAVNGGVSRYVALLNSNEEVFEAFARLRDVIFKALEIYKQNCGPELQSQYELLCERSRQWKQIYSVRQGFF